jgi:hypothetical protein
LTKQPWVDIRVPGRRELDDVPLSELAATMRTLNGHSRTTSDQSKLSLFKNTARRFNVQRLTPQWLPRLEKALAIAFNQQ